MLTAGHRSSQGTLYFMDTSFLEQDLEQLKAGAVERLTAATDGFVRWAERVRDPRAPFRMRWAVDSLRDANVAATNYILGQLKEAGILHRVLDEEQQRQGRQWVESLQVAPGSYEDPALLAYKPPIWDDVAEPWPPTTAHKEAMNQYSSRTVTGRSRSRSRGSAGSRGRADTAAWSCAGPRSRRMPRRRAAGSCWTPLAARG